MVSPLLLVDPDLFCKLPSFQTKNCAQIYGSLLLLVKELEEKLWTDECLTSYNTSFTRNSEPYLTFVLCYRIIHFPSILSIIAAFELECKEGLQDRLKQQTHTKYNHFIICLARQKLAFNWSSVVVHLLMIAKSIFLVFCCFWLQSNAPLCGSQVQSEILYTHTPSHWV